MTINFDHIELENIDRFSIDSARVLNSKKWKYNVVKQKQKWRNMQKEYANLFAKTLIEYAEHRLADRKLAEYDPTFH